jgi:hypothetical protein
MKTLITSVLAILLILCGTKLKEIEATSQQWMGGRYESGRGTDYIIKLQAKGGSDKLVVDRLWVGENSFEVRAVKDLARMSVRDFAKNDTIYLRAGLKYQPDENGNMVQVTGEKVEPPRDFEGEALISYTWKGKRRFLEIDEFTVLEKIIYP